MPEAIEAIIMVLQDLFVAAGECWEINRSRALRVSCIFVDFFFALLQNGIFFRIKQLNIGMAALVQDGVFPSSAWLYAPGCFARRLKKRDGAEIAKAFARPF